MQQENESTRENSLSLFQALFSFPFRTPPRGFRFHGLATGFLYSRFSRLLTLWDIFERRARPPPDLNVTLGKRDHLWQDLRHVEVLKLVPFPGTAVQNVTAVCTWKTAANPVVNRNSHFRTRRYTPVCRADTSTTEDIVFQSSHSAN